MKRCFCLLLTICTVLCACGGNPNETTLPMETTAPEGLVSSPETTVPAETAAPPVTDPVPENSSYLLPIDDPETMIYAGPAFRYGAVDMVGEAGVYTIVEEVTDRDGNLWGRLKSGAGWLCLTQPPLAPIRAEYAGGDFRADYSFRSGDEEYITELGFTAAEMLTEVRFGLLDWFETETWQMAEVLYTIDTLEPDRSFLAQVVFWGDMTTYGISFTGEDGQERHYCICISGKDGSLICREYE